MVTCDSSITEKYMQKLGFGPNIKALKEIILGQDVISCEYKFLNDQRV